jgi:uncharacterized protein (DUF2344 family)
MRIFFHYVLPISIALILGVVIGVIIRDFPLLTFNREVKIIDVFRWVSTVGIGVYIPLVIKKLIDDKRSEKNNLVEELNYFIKVIDQIQDSIKKIHGNNKIYAKEKDVLNLQFDLSDKEIQELCNFLNDNCKKQISPLITELKDSYTEYWKVSTSNDVIASSVKKISDDTYKQISLKYTDINKKLRKIKAELIKN